MKKTMPLLIACMMVAGIAHATIGATVHDCSRLYGTPVKIDSTIREYRWNSLHVTIRFGGFSNNQAVSILYRKADGTRLLESDVKKLLSQNSESGKRWNEVDPWGKGYFSMSEIDRNEAARRSNEGLRWIRAGRDARAFYPALREYLSIELTNP